MATAVVIRRHRLAVLIIIESQTSQAVTGPKNRGAATGGRGEIEDRQERRGNGK